MKTILLMDQFRSSLELQAFKEGIFPELPRQDLISFETNKYTQEILSLILLFDEFILFRSEVMEENEAKIKILEDEGLIKYLPVDYPNYINREGDSGYIKASTLKNFIKLLEKDYYLRNLLVKSLLGNLSITKHPPKNISELKYIEDIIDYAIAFYSDDSIAMKKNRIEKVFHKSFIENLKNSLSEKLILFGKHLKIFNVILNLLIHYYETNKLLRDFSFKNEIPIATIEHNMSYMFDNQDNYNNKTDTANGLSLFKAVLEEEFINFPYIENLQDALKLRKDKSIIEFRNLFFNFIKKLSKGDVDAISILRNEIFKIRKDLRKIKKIESVLRWATYFSLPLTTAGVFSPVISALGIPLSALSFTGTYIAQNYNKKHGWMFIGK